MERVRLTKCGFVYRGNPEGITRRARQKDHVDEWREQERCGFTYRGNPEGIARRSRRRKEWEGKYENHPKVLPHQTDDPRARFKADIEVACSYREDLEDEIRSLEKPIGSPGRRIDRPSHLRLVVDNDRRKPAVKVVSSPDGDDAA